MMERIQQLELDKAKIAKYYEKKINDLEQQHTKKKMEAYSYSEKIDMPNNFKTILANQI